MSTRWRTGPVVVVPIPQMGRFAHEATTCRPGIRYQTEDRSCAGRSLSVPVRPGPAGGAVRQFRRNDGAARGPDRQGPSNLPRMARDLGRFVNEARLQLEEFKADIYSTEEEDKQNSRRRK